MNRRLVWNFELTDGPCFNWADLQDEEKEEINWEARYFWAENTIIQLQDLDNDFLNISNYKAKHREDNYILLAKDNFNIKQRGSRLLYKPLVQESAPLYGYGKKIDLNDCSEHELLPATNGLKAADLLILIESEHKEKRVIKEALIYTLQVKPKINIELSRLEVCGDIYFSLGIEGRSKQKVNTLARHLLGELVSCDYVSFLKGILHL